MPSPSHPVELVLYFLVLMSIAHLRCASNLGDNCCTNAECTTKHAVCSSGRCACPGSSSYVRPNNTDTCFPRMRLYSVCQPEYSQKQCPDRAECTSRTEDDGTTDTVCACTDGNFQYYSSCHPKISLGNTCYFQKHDEQCLDGNSHCVITLTGYRCECKDGFHINKTGKCHPNDQASDWALAQNKSIATYTGPQQQTCICDNNSGRTSIIIVAITCAICFIAMLISVIIVCSMVSKQTRRKNDRSERPDQGFVNKGYFSNMRGEEYVTVGPQNVQAPSTNAVYIP